MNFFIKPLQELLLINSVTKSYNFVLQNKFFFNQKVFFAYYRFHKRIGKGRWGRYVERYIRPRSIENTQRLIYNYTPNFTNAKNVNSWMWNLPKNVARACTASEVLDAAIYYRHKRFRPYHYLKILKRLVDVGGCEVSDWRFRFLARRIILNKHNFLNLPRIGLYFAKLGAKGDLQNICKFLWRRIDVYTPQQLCMIAYSFSLCNLQDKYLFSLIYKKILPSISIISSSNLVQLTQGYAGCMICNTDLLREISNETQKRMKNVNDKKIFDEEKENENYSFPRENLISMQQLIDIGEAFSKLKYQDASYFEMLSSQMQYILMNSGYTTPVQITKLLESFLKLKVNDISLLERVLAHADEYMYDYTPMSLAVLGVCTVVQLPYHLPHIIEVHTKVSEFLLDYTTIMDMPTVEKTAHFISKCRINDDIKKRMITELATRTIELCDISKDFYDLPKLFEVFLQMDVNNLILYEKIHRNLHRFFDFFEPQDFSRTSRCILTCKRKFGFLDNRVLNALARHTIKRHDELSDVDYISIWNNFVQAKLPDSRYVQKLLRLSKEKKPMKGFEEFRIISDFDEKALKPDEKIIQKKFWLFGTKFFGQKNKINRLNLKKC